MGVRRVVQDVMIINREDWSGFANRIVGSDLYVGDSSSPQNNTKCNVMPQSSGVYSCGGKIGYYLGIYNSYRVITNISQIRAYSYTANAYENYEYLKSALSNNCSDSNLIFTN